MTTSISVKNISKSFIKYQTEFHRFLSWFGVPVKQSSTLILDNISFTIGQGQAVALVGQNGAGKSTLLKMIAKTLSPSCGQIECHGRVAAILELGMGFNPEFTGRQNAYHVLSMMGYDNNDCDSVIDQINEFSEIGTYFDEPVRVYSSGMQMRVAFAVATAYRPDILIIDEALSVGDNYFQHKSFARIKAFKDQGSTLLFVSHDKHAILELCSRAILIENHKVKMDGKPNEVMDFYNALIAEKEVNTIEQTQIDTNIITKSGNQKVQFVEYELQDKNNRPLEEVETGQEVVLKTVIQAHQDAEDVVLGYKIRTLHGHEVFGTNTYFVGKTIPILTKGSAAEVRIRFPAKLGEGNYSITLSLHKGENHLAENYDWLDCAMAFEVINKNYPYFIGSSFLDTKFDVKLIKTTQSEI